jgi:hypothetical protein
MSSRTFKTNINDRTEERLREFSKNEEFKLRRNRKNTRDNLLNKKRDDEEVENNYKEEV